MGYIDPLTVCQKINQNIWVGFGIPLRGADPEQKAGTIHESTPEHLLIVKAPSMLSSNPRPNITSYHVCMEAGDGNGGKLGFG